MDEIDPIDLSRALSEIPLFKEFQRLVAGSSGPVNFQIAQQIAKAMSSAGRVRSSGTEEDAASLREACRLAEMRIGEVTRLEPLHAMRQVELLSRERWAEVNLEGFRPLIGALAERIGMQIAPAGASLLSALGPLFMGIQMGMLVGQLARVSLGQYEVCLPRNDLDTIYLIVPNIAAVEEDLQVDPKQFRMWLALHEVAHQLEFSSISWTRPYLLDLISRYIDEAQLDPQELMKRLESVADPEEVNRLMSRPEELLPMLLAPDQRQAMDRIQVVLAILEGYADHIAYTAGVEILPEIDRIREGMTRRRAERSSAERLLERLLGIDLPHEQYRAGVRFVEEVAKAGHLDTLLQGASTLPNPDELAEPARWLSRVAFG